jgi:hypothetical protein
MTFRPVTRPALGIAAILAAALLLGACGHGSSKSSKPPSPRTRSSAPPGQSMAQTPTPSPGGLAPGTGRCHTAALTASLVEPSAGAGQRYVKISLTNRSTTTCVLLGYGGLQLLDAAGHPLATRLHRVPPPAHSINLPPRASATSQLHWSAVPGAGEPVSGACEPTPQAANVTPPDETASLRVPWTMGAVCLHGSVDQQPYV